MPIVVYNVCVGHKKGPLEEILVGLNSRAYGGPQLDGNTEPN